LTAWQPLPGTWVTISPTSDHPTKGPGDLELRTQGNALLHVLEEVTQHHGQAEITRDLLLRELRELR
jgi:hypothetical protein